MDDAEEKKRISCGGCLGISLLIFGFFVVVLALGIAYWRNQARSDTDAKLTAIRSSGEPTGARELVDYTRGLSELPDMTDQWKNALQFVDEPQFKEATSTVPYFQGQSYFPPPGESWNGQKASEELIATYVNELRVIHQLANVEGQVHFVDSYDDAFNLLLPYTDRTRGAARALVVEAHVAAHQGHQGRKQDVLRSIDSMFAIADTLEYEPILVSMLVRIAIESMAVITVQDLAPHLDLTDAESRALAAKLQARSILPHVSLAMKGERAIVIETVLSSRLLQEQELGPIAFNKYDSLRLYLDDAQDLINAVDAENEQQMGRQLTSVANRIESELQNAGLTTRFRRMLSMQLTPSYSSISKAILRERFLLDAAATSLMLEVYRDKHGHYPKSLNDLLPDLINAIPMDPHDGKPLRYLITADGYKIYSVGENGVDDEGSYSLGDFTRPDLVFEVPRRFKPEEMGDEAAIASDPSTQVEE